MKRICKPWRAMEKARLRQEYKKIPTAELAARMGRTKSSVKRMAGHLGLTGPNHAPWKWTADRWRKFGEAYRKSPKQAAERFGLSRQSAWTYSKVLRLHYRKPWSDQEDNLLRTLYPKHIDDDFVEQTGRSLKALRTRAYRLGLRREPKKNLWLSGAMFWHGRKPKEQQAS